MMNYEARPYPVNVYLIDDEKEYKDVVGRKAMKGTLGTTEWTDDGDILIYWNDQNPATLVHEIVHASLFILEHVGIDAHSNNGECLAYMVDNMFTYFIKGIIPQESNSEERGQVVSV